MEKKEQLLLIEPQNELKFIGEYVCANETGIFGEPKIEMKANEKANRNNKTKIRMQMSIEYNKYAHVIRVNIRSIYVRWNRT